MPGSSDASFIPKRGGPRRSKKVRSNRVYILTIVSYVLLFATLLAAGGTFLYHRYLDTQLENAVAALSQEIRSFQQADMEQVQAFDLRLRQANQRLNNSVSVVSIFEAIEAATINTVRLANLSLSREVDEQFVVEAEVVTDNFDSSLFQRGVYERNDEVVQSIRFESLQLNSVNSDPNQVFQTNEETVTFQATLEVPLGAIPFVPSRQNLSTSEQLSPIHDEDVTEDAATSSINRAFDETNELAS